jgi:DNA-directed RNA polymerase sigma subunit (sigma70/sigma32)
LSIYAPYATNGRINDNCRLIDFLVDNKESRNNVQDKISMLSKAINLTHLTEKEKDVIRKRIRFGRPDGNTKEGKRVNGIFYYALKKIRRTIRVTHS